MSTPFAGSKIDLWRKAERERLLTARRAFTQDERVAIAAKLATHLDALLARRFPGVGGLCVSGYWPIKAEFDLRPWLQSLRQRGARLALPVVETRAAPLVFREWREEVPLERGHWNILAPPADAARVTPDIALAPFIGWDAACYRLGYGGGYFDRTLAALPQQPFAIGVGLQAARLATIHPQPHDRALGAIVTEAGLQAEATA